MHLAPVSFALVLAAAPVAAQDMAAIEGCAKAGFGDAACDTDMLAEELGLLGINEVREFRSYGMESFAMLTALRYAASAIYFAAEGEGCVAEEERTAAVEIWSLWVQKPDDLPDAVAAKFETFDTVMNHVVQMEVGC